MRLRDAGETMALGRRIGLAATAGTTLALTGGLGAGKTTFVRGLAEGLSVPTRIASPTFVLVAVHEGGRLVLWHADLYRLEGAAELDQLALEDASDGVLAVEWADRFPQVLPADHLEIRLDDDGRGGRVATFEATGPVHRALAGVWGD
jgi:tRNA threonylcarbamoyladenosine biosynthesis protein TsaE